MRAQYCTSIVAFLQIIEPSHHLKDLQLWRAVYMYKTPPSASLDEAQLDDIDFGPLRRCQRLTEARERVTQRLADFYDLSVQQVDLGAVALIVR